MIRKIILADSYSIDALYIFSIASFSIILKSVSDWLILKPCSNALEKLAIIL